MQRNATHQERCKTDDNTEGTPKAGEQQSMPL